MHLAYLHLVISAKVAVPCNRPVRQIQSLLPESSIRANLCGFNAC